MFNKFYLMNHSFVWLISIFSTSLHTLHTLLPNMYSRTSIKRPPSGLEKAKAKAYADCKRHASQRNLKIGDFVLVTQRHTNKYSTKFHRNPMKIVEIHGTQIIIEAGHGKQHRRNISHVKLFIRPAGKETESSGHSRFRWRQHHNSPPSHNHSHTALCSH